MIINITIFIRNMSTQCTKKSWIWEAHRNYQGQEDGLS